MSNLSRREGEPNLQGPQPERELQHLSADDLKQRRQDLEARVEAARRQKEADIAKQLQTREAMVAEDTRLAPLLDEARRTLDYFELQNNQGLLADAQDVAELDNLRRLVASLEEQRAEALQTYDAIMSQPEMYDRVWDEAHQEKRLRERRQRQEAAGRDLEQKVVGFFGHLRDLASSQEYANGEKEARERVFRKARENVNAIIKKAKESLRARQIETAQAISAGTEADSYVEFIDQLERYRKTLGPLRGKEKAAVDFVLHRKEVFNEAERKWEDYSEARLRAEQLNAKNVELAEEYRALMLDAWKSQNGLDEEFGATGRSGVDSIPGQAHYSLKRLIEEDADIERGSGSTRKGKFKDINEARRADRRIDQLLRSYESIQEKAGQYIWMKNPETKA